ncbi:VanW family protein [Modestobacter sp. L9-4]|uniref:VanW family protein n=1 Tax=Modestobacter sp. L9-4 TaxID=2851567 RepID=UPI001C779BC5|nr:VanW family protein [Modestobacter sp. L9-4]QXG76575.1 VanW family protein [Modestobacter sp. L9-4]
MPQDPSDTVRLEPDGTIGSARRGQPPVPDASPSAPEETQVIGGPVAAQPAPERDEDQDATRHIAPVVDETSALPPVRDDGPHGPDATSSDPLPSDSTQHIAPVPPVADDTTALPPVPRDGDDPSGPGGPPDSPTGGGAAWWRRRAVLVPAAAVLALAAAYGVDLLVAGDAVPRGTVVAGVELGGLSPASAAARLESDLAPRVAADRTVQAGDVRGSLHPASAGLALDVPATVDAVDDQPLAPWTRLGSLFGGERRADPVLTSDDAALTAQLDQLATTVDRPPVDASIEIDGTTPRLVEPVDGRALDRAGAAQALTAALVSGADPATPVALPVTVTAPRVAPAEAQRVLDSVVTPALAAPVSVVGSGGGDPAELPASAIAAALTFTPADDGTLTVALDPTELQAAMGDDLTVFGTPAQDARFEVSGDTVSVVPSVDGQGIDPTDLATQLLPVLDDPAPRSVTAALGPVPAAFTTEDAQALGVKEKVSDFTTRFTNSASGTNIRVVAEEVDGALVRPGETFSLNGYTGPRGTAQGYVPAAVISGGELSQAVGGGISQFATTMFNAVFFAGLEDVHHKPHSFYISRYPAGREATVYEGQIDLQWRNDTDTGIYVQTEWVPGALTVSFWGTKHYEIESVSSERRNLRQPAVQDKVDDGNCTPQSGSTGFDITVTRVFKDPVSGAELRREDFDTHYAAEAVIRCVPAPAPEPAAPAPGQPAPGQPAPEQPPATSGAPASSAPAGRRPGHRTGADARAARRRR